jgi:hypothetical protein
VSLVSVVSLRRHALDGFKPLMRSLGIAAVLAILAPSALAQSARPDSHRTPGAINPAVTQDTIASTICVKGWTRTVRPPRKYTSALKRHQVREWAYADRKMGDFEEDRLVPLVLCGSPTDPRNLWPEPSVLCRSYCGGRCRTPAAPSSDCSRPNFAVERPIGEAEFTADWCWRVRALAVAQSIFAAPPERTFHRPTSQTEMDEKGDVEGPGPCADFPEKRCIVIL